METEPANSCALAQTVSHWSGVHPGPVHVTSPAEAMAMAQFSLPLLQFSPSVSFHQCCTHLHPNTTLIKRRNRQRFGAFIQSNVLLDIRWHCTGQYCHIVSMQNINVQSNILQFSTSCSKSNKSVPTYIS